MSTNRNPTTETDRRVFGALLDEWAAAIVANDAEWMRAFVTPDWTFVTESGVSPGTRLLDAVASGDVTHDSMSFDIERVARLGDTVALVTSRGRNTGAFRGEAFSADEWTTDVFVRDGDRWLCALTQLTPVPPSPPASPPATG
jgi:uncharacterized protein (TIGR02246 family)